MNDTPVSSTHPELVSVVVGLLESERFLREAVHSVFAQTHEHWELLLVGDRSTGASTRLARMVAERCPDRVTCLDHPGADGDTGALRNLGLRHARGAFVAFLDADGVWLPLKLERQLHLMRGAPQAGVVYGGTQLWYSWSGEPHDVDRDRVPDLGVPLGVPIEGTAFLQRLLRREVPPSRVASLMVRRDLVQAVGAYEPGLRGEDADLAVTAKLCLGASLLATGECWDRCRRHGSAGAPAVGTQPDRRPVSRQLLQWLDGYLGARGIDGPVRRALQVELARHDPPRPAGRLRRLARRATSASARHWIRRRHDPHAAPPAGHVVLGDLRRLTPLSRRWGKDRGGRPIDRYYVERFLAAHAADIRGRVLEVEDDAYTRRFGGQGVSRRDVVHPVAGNPSATIVADLARDTGVLPEASFDCVILTQVLHVMADPGAAVSTTYRILRPGGVVLATLAGISQISRWDMERWGDYWRFTTASARRLFARVFPLDHMEVQPHGNVLTAVAFLQGLAAEELRPGELDHLDPDYQLLITVRAVKPRRHGPVGGAIDRAASHRLVPFPW